MRRLEGRVALVTGGNSSAQSVSVRSAGERDKHARECSYYQSSGVPRSYRLENGVLFLRDITVKTAIVRFTEAD